MCKSHAHSTTDIDIKQHWRVGLGPDFAQINNAFNILSVTPKGWDMSLNLILLSVHALKVIPVAATPLPVSPTVHIPPNANVLVILQSALPTVTHPPPTSSIPTHIGTIPIGDFKNSVRQEIGNYKFFTEPTLEQSKHILVFPTGCYYCRMRNHASSTYSFLMDMKTRACTEYNATRTAATTTPPVNTPTPTTIVSPTSVVSSSNNNANNVEVMELPTSST